MPVVAPLTGHLDMALSNFIKGFRNNQFIADLLFPRVPVVAQTDKYYVYGRETQQLRNKTLRAPGDPAEQWSFTLSTDNYFCPSNALAATLPDESQRNFGVGDLRMTTARGIWQNLMLAREARVAALATTIGNYANSITLSGTSQWNDYTNSDPISVVEAGKAAIVTAGVQANTLILGDSVYRKLRNHPLLLQRFQYKDSGPPSIGVQQMAAAFDVENVIVGSGIKDNGDGTQSFLWGKFAILAYVDPATGPAGVLSNQVGTISAGAPSIVGAEGNVGPEDISFGKTFVWTNAPGTVDGYGVVIGRLPNPTAKADIVGVDSYFNEKITAKETGYLIANAVA